MRMKQNSKIGLAKKVLIGSMAAVIALTPACPSALAAFKEAEQPAITMFKGAKAKSLSKATVKVADAVYSGKALKPSLTVTYGKAKLKNGKDYTVSYSSNKNIGLGKVTIKAKAKSGYSGSKTVKFKIVPSKPKVSYSATASSITLKWGKIKGAGYYNVYSVDSKGKNAKKLKSLSGTSFKISKLKDSKNYYYAVKACTKKGNDVYSGKASYITARTSVSIPSASDKKVVAASFNRLINTAKKQKNMTVHKTTNVQLSVTDCSVSFMEKPLNAIIGSFTEPSDEYFVFKNGKNDSYGVTPNEVITPGEREVTLAADGISKATVTKKGNGYQLKIKLVKEKAFFDGTQNTVSPIHHESCLSPLNFESLELPTAATIMQASIDYPGATFTLTVSGAGKLTAYSINFPLSGSGIGKLMELSFFVGIEGAMKEKYSFAY